MVVWRVLSCSYTTRILKGIGKVLTQTCPMSDLTMFVGLERVDWHYASSALRAFITRPWRQVVAHLTSHLWWALEAMDVSEWNKIVAAVICIQGRRCSHWGGWWEREMDGDGPWSSAQRSGLRIKESASNSICCLNCGLPLPKHCNAKNELAITMPIIVEPNMRQKLLVPTRFSSRAPACAACTGSRDRWWTAQGWRRWARQGICADYYEREGSGVGEGGEGGRMDSLWWVPVDTVGYRRERSTMPIIYVYDVIQLITL